MGDTPMKQSPEEVAGTGSRSQAEGPPGREERVCPLSEGLTQRSVAVLTLPRGMSSETGTSLRVLERLCSEFWGGFRGSGVPSSPVWPVKSGQRVSQCE